MLLYGDVCSYLRYLRARQGCQRAAEREERWYGKSFGS